MSTSDIYFYSDNSGNTLIIDKSNCSLEENTEQTGPKSIDRIPVYDSSGNQIWWQGPNNPYDPYNSTFYETKYTISGLNNSSTIEIKNTNGFYYIDLNNWVEKSNNGSTLTFNYSTNPTLSVINSTEISIRKGLYNITSFLDKGLTNTSNTIKRFI